MVAIQPKGLSLVAETISNRGLSLVIATLFSGLSLVVAAAVETTTGLSRKQNTYEKKKHHYFLALHLIPLYRRYGVSLI